MQNITPLDDRSLEPFLSESLDDLVSGDLSQYRENPATYDDWEILTRSIIRELGEIKGQSSIDTIWSVAETAEVPLLKSEALIALGQMRAVDYAPEIAMILRNLNFNVRGDKESAEIEAYGAVVALEKMKDEIGFEPLFYASIGWYSDRVSSLASEAILTLSDDPTVQLIRIMQDDSDYNQKRKALSVSQETNASASGKTEVAIAALREGLKYAEQDFSLRNQLANLRKDAIAVLISNDVSHPEAPGLLNGAINEGDMDEKLFAIQALGLDKGDEAAGILSERLDFYNTRQRNGLAINSDELTIVRQLIFALGESGNEKGLEPLSEMSYLDYTPAIVRQANNAIEKIGGN